MQRRKRCLSAFWAFIIVLTASITTCAATGTNNSIAVQKNTDKFASNAKYKYTFKPILVKIDLSKYSILF